MQSLNPRTIKLTAVEARQQFGEIINRAYYAGETFVVERAGQPMIKIMPVMETNQQKAAKKRFWKFVDDVRQQLAPYDEREVDTAFDEALQVIKTP
jgi:antitoxin (DNA-binding transcriptional repressor) of toxin-antitoxin stability system